MIICKCKLVITVIAMHCQTLLDQNYLWSISSLFTFWQQGRNPSSAIRLDSGQTALISPAPASQRICYSHILTIISTDLGSLSNGHVLTSISLSTEKSKTVKCLWRKCNCNFIAYWNPDNLNRISSWKLFHFHLVMVSFIFHVLTCPITLKSETQIWLLHNRQQL